MSGSSYKFDARGALQKTAELKALPKAAKFALTEWAADTVRILKMSARTLQRSGKGKKTGQLGRNVGMLTGVKDGKWTVAVGTGIGGTVSVPYARIQDLGGVTHPRVSDKMRKWAWFMYRKEAGVQARALRKELPGLSRGKAKEAGRMAASMYLGIALTKKDRLTVHVPATNWFTGVVEGRKRDLAEAMRPEHIMKIAAGMAREKGV